MAVRYIGTSISGIASDTKPTPSANEMGVIFVETDTNKLYIRDDNTWDEVSPSTILVTDNESTSENNLLPFVANAATATGQQSLEMDGDFHYNPGTGTVTATAFAGATSGAVTASSIALNGNITTAAARVWTLMDNDDEALSFDASGKTGMLVFDTRNGAERITMSGDLTIAGTLTVATTTTVSSTTINVADPLIALASNNAANSVDIGFYGKYVASGTKYTGLVWDAGASKYILFHGNAVAPTTTVNTGGSGHTISTLIANLEGAVTGNASTATNVAGTGLTGSTLASGITASSLTSLGAQAANLNMNSNSVYNVTQLSGSHADGPRVAGDEASSATNPVFIVDRQTMTTGIGGTGSSVATIVGGSERIRATATAIDFNGDISITGGSPRILTIGANGNGDNKIVFDANDADWYMGTFHDRNDELQIGLGSAVGTNERITLTATQTTFNNDNANIDFGIDGDTNNNVFFVDASTERVGIGTSSPDRDLEVSKVTDSGTVLGLSNWGTSAASSGGIRFQKSRATSEGTFTATADGDLLGTLGFYGSDSNSTASARSSWIDVIQAGSAGSSTVASSMAFGSSGAERMRLVSANMIIGYTASIGQADGETGLLQVHGIDSRGSLGLTRWSDDSGSGGIWIAKSRGATVGATHGGGTAVNSGDELGRIIFSADDSTNILTPGVKIGAYAEADGTTNDIEANLRFHTNSGSAAVTERMRIAANGNVGIGTAAPDSTLTVANTGTSTSNIALKLHGGYSNNASVTGIGFSSNGLPNNADRMKGAFLYAGDGTGYNRGDFVWLQDSAGDTGQAVIGDEVMRLTNAGNLGIGLTNPTDKLKVTGNIQLTRSGSQFIGTSATGAAIAINSTGGAQVEFEASGSDDKLHLVTHTSGSSHARRLTVDAAGNVGIGTTSPKGLVDMRTANNTSFDAAKTPIVSNHADASGTFAGIGYSLRSASPAKAWIGLVYSTGYGRGDLVFLNDNNGDDYTVALADEVMRITHEGDVVMPATKKLYFDGGDHTYISEGSANQMHLAAGGQIFAYGTASQFHVQIAGTDSWQFDSAAFGSRHAGGVQIAKATVDTHPKIYFNGDTDTGFGHPQANEISVFTGDASGSPDFLFQEDGDFHANGDVYAFSGSVSSDIALKENIAIIPNALDKISQLEGVSWDWKEKTRGSSIGLVAQNVEKIFPDLITDVKSIKDETTHKNLNYNGLIGLLVESIKELKDEITELKNGSSR